MRLLRSLRVRLLASYLAVVAVGALTLFLVADRVAPDFFRAHLRLMGHPMRAMAFDMATEIDRAFVDSLRRALWVAVGASSAAALALSAFVASRLLRPLDRIRAATRRMAKGEFGERIPLPAEEELAALASDFNALAETLDETEQRRLQLIGEVSHELRTPLSTIEAYMEGLIDGVLPATAETFAAVSDEAGRLKRLASDLIALSRAEEGAIDLRVRDIDLADVARSAAERLRPQFDDQGVSLDARLPALPVRGDPDRLTQVIVNLLGNALAHTPPGGRVTITGESGTRVRLSVTDTGRGIAPEDLERIFDRFFRADRSVRGGSGIGLTIARSIVRAHGGELTAASPGPGRGATFTVELPRLLETTGPS